MTDLPEISRNFGPKCPNHKVVLSDCKDGVGICPISGCRFSYDADEAKKTFKLKMNAFGGYAYEADWNIQSLDGKET